jgi:predicted transcriptional regulator
MEAKTWKPYEKLVVVTFKIEPSTLAKLNQLTYKTRRSRSEIIREAIMEYMRKLSKSLGEDIESY